MRGLWGPALASVMFAGCYEGATAHADAIGGTADGSADGSDEGTEGEGGYPASCLEQPELAPTPLVRLSQAEYRNTVADILGVDVDVTLPPDDVEGLFRSNALAPVGLLHVEAYAEAAATIAAAVPIETLLACDDDMSEAKCADAFIASFGRRAYRRPLTPEELDAARALFDTVSAEATLAESVRVLVEAFLQAPQFLYRVESVSPEGPRALSDYEIGTRLSYFLWNTAPDEMLLAAAEAGELSDPEALEAHARRMLASPRADAMLAEFHAQWLGLDGGEEVSKDPELFPEFDASLLEAMRLETQLLIANVLQHGDARLSTLFSSEYSLVNDALLALYGGQRDDGWLPQEAGAALPAGFFPARLPADQRAGLLTHASILAALAKPDQTAPILRGTFVLERLLCVDLPQPPPSVDADPPQPDPTQTAREQYRQHSEDPACNGCHQIIDPVGFAFENYDPIGRFRTVDPGGNPIDARGEIDLVHAIGDAPSTIALDGVVDLAHAIADSADLADCVTRQWYRYALARREHASGEECLIADLYGTLDVADGDIRELVIGVVTSPTFRYAVSN